MSSLWGLKLFSLYIIGFITEMFCLHNLIIFKHYFAKLFSLQDNYYFNQYSKNVNNSFHAMPQ